MLLRRVCVEFSHRWRPWKSNPIPPFSRNGGDARLSWSTRRTATGSAPIRCPRESPRVPSSPPQSWRNGGKRGNGVPTPKASQNGRAAFPMGRRAAVRDIGQGRRMSWPLSPGPKRTSALKRCQPLDLRVFCRAMDLMTLLRRHEGKTCRRSSRT